MNAFDNLKLCAYLFVADSFDNGTNVYERFCPIVELLLSQKTDKYVSFNNLLDEINQIYDLKISRATLNELLNRIARKGIIKRNKSGFDVIGEKLGKTYSFDKSKKEAELEDLYTDFYKFLLENNYDIKKDEVKDLLCRFVFTHSYELFDLLNNSSRIDSTNDDDIPAIFAEHLYNYLIRCKNNKKEMYNHFLRLHNGAVHASLLNFNPQKMKEFSKNELEIEQLVLDSNFIMRILDLQIESDCLTAQDTLAILKKKNVKLIVLSETIYEIVNTIRNFLDNSAPYTSYTKDLYRSNGIKFNGLHAALQRGKTRTALQEIATYDKIKSMLISSNIGCCVLDEECVLSQNEELINSLIKAKDRDTYKTKQAQHDLALIDWCRKNRSRTISSVKTAKTWVLTNDIKLTDWNKRNTKSTVQECITECQICHLIWIDEPKNVGNGMISTILALANRNSINDGQIESFLKTAETYKHKLETSTEIDMFTLALDSDRITTQDILYAYSSEKEFDEMIKNKAKANKEENLKKDAVIKEQEQRNKTIETNAKISDLEKCIAVLEKEIFEIKLNNHDLEKDKDRIMFQKDKYKKIERTAVRITASIFLLAFSLCVIIAVCLFPHFKNIAIEIAKNQTVINIFSFSFSIVSSILGYIILGIITNLLILILGEPIKPTDLFPYIKNKLLGHMITRDADLNSFDMHTYICIFRNTFHYEVYHINYFFQINFPFLF